MMEDKENVIEFLRDSDTATVTFTQGRFITKIKRLSESYPDKVIIKTINKDGSIVAHIPVSYIRINPRRELTEEQMQVLSDRAKRNFGYAEREEIEDDDNY